MILEYTIPDQLFQAFSSSIIINIPIKLLLLCLCRCIFFLVNLQRFCERRDVIVLHLLDILSSYGAEGSLMCQWILGRAVVVLVVLLELLL